MGSSSSKETPEKMVKNDPNLTTGQHKELSEKSESSICEIKTNDGYGTGFICTLKYPDKNTKIVCLITNYHVINEDMINYKENIEIILNKENKKIDLMKERRIWMDEKIDYTIIELLIYPKTLKNHLISMTTAIIIITIKIITIKNI